MTGHRRTRIYLLPGLDGTAKLLGHFVAECPPEFEPVPIAYPPDRVLDYDSLADVVGAKIAGDVPMILLGESFGGPLALRLASSKPKNLIGVVLVATFVMPPARSFWRLLPWGLGFRMRAPVYAIRAARAGRTASGELLRRASDVVREVSADVLAARVWSVLSVDAREWLRNCPSPILYLAGKQDRLVKARSFEAINEIRPDVVHREIDAPHFVLQIAPAEAWRAIGDFVAETVRS
ncbi:MAG: alpha/beta hydrolase [Verrucomicrobia bacterium]|nr:alpha/beta hydrolase [Verrucomicrobiota bacterium]